MYNFQLYFIISTKWYIFSIQYEVQHLPQARRTKHIASSQAQLRVWYNQEKQLEQYPSITTNKIVIFITIIRQQTETLEINAWIGKMEGVKVPPCQRDQTSTHHGWLIVFSFNHMSLPRRVDVHPDFFFPDLSVSVQ